MGGALAGTHFLANNLRNARKSGGERRLRRAGNSRYAYRTCTRYIVYAYTRPILGSTRFRETPPTLKKSLLNRTKPTVRRYPYRYGTRTVLVHSPPGGIVRLQRTYGTVPIPARGGRLMPASNVEAMTYMSLVLYCTSTEMTTKAQTLPADCCLASQGPRLAQGGTSRYGTSTVLYISTDCTSQQYGSKVRVRRTVRLPQQRNPSIRTFIG